MQYVDMKQKRKDAGYKTPNKLAKKMLESGKIRTIRAELAQVQDDPNTKQQSQTRSLGNRIRDLEKGVTDWWENKKNQEALERLAHVLDVPVENIPIGINAQREKRLFFWNEIPDAKPFDPMNEKTAETGLVRNIPLYSKVWYKIPHGWGRKFFLHFYQYRYEIPVISVEDLASFEKEASKAYADETSVILSIEKPIFSAESCNDDNQKESEHDDVDLFCDVKSRNFDGFLILVLAPFFPRNTEANQWYKTSFKPCKVWRANFVNWMCSRLSLESKARPEEILQLLEEVDEESVIFSSPKDLLPVIQLCHKNGTRICKDSIRTGTFVEEVILSRTQNNKELANIFIESIGVFSTDHEYMLNQSLEEKSWSEMLLKARSKSCKILPESALSELKKHHLLTNLDASRLQAPAWCFEKIAQQAINKIVKEGSPLIGKLSLDQGRQKYIDNALKNLDQKEWLAVLNQVVKRFDLASLYSVAEIEAFFSVIASKLKHPEQIQPKEYVLYQDIFKCQMQTLVQKWDRSVR